MESGDRDPRAYLLVNDRLVFMRSPRSLMFKAETAGELVSELIAYLPTYRKDPMRALDTLDAISTILCLTLDACETMRAVHPRYEFTSQAIQAQKYLEGVAQDANGNRLLYEPIVRLCEPAVWEDLTTEQRQFVKIMREEMESSGLNLSPARLELVAGYFSHIDSIVSTIVSAEMGSMEPLSIIGDLLTTRYSVAEVLGYDSYAAWAMRSSLIENPLQAWHMLLSFAKHLDNGVKEETLQLLEEKQKLHGAKSSSEIVLRDYELKDISALVRKRDHGDPETEMMPYLTMENAWHGLELMCKDVFNVRLVKADMEHQEQYEKSVVKYHLYTHDDELLGTLYADLIARPGKPEGSGHYTVQLGHSISPMVMNDLDLIIPPDDRLQPIIVFACSFEGVFADDQEMSASHYSEVTTWGKVLLTPNETVSLFHEFGHALHTLLGQTKYQVLSGTRSSLDYVEVWSQLCETYARDFRSLQKWAKHHEDGTTVPRDVVDRLNAKESAFSCLVQLEEIVTACVDLVYHGPRPMAYVKLNDEGEMESYLVPEGMETPRELRELIGGYISPLKVTELGYERSFVLPQLANYASNYYSYTYSRLVATVIWNKYLRDDPFNLTSGKKIADVMRKGASGSPKAMLAGLVDDLSPPAIMKALGISEDEAKLEPKANSS